MATIEVIPHTDRFHTDIGWLDSKHSFSFGQHWDPDNTGHGLLLVSNDDVVAPGGGFGTHPHRDMEIVTWVLDGELEHRDSEGNEGVIYPGLAQRMSAGTGILHSEMNHSDTGSVHFVQMWVPPDQNGNAPGYEQRDVSEALDAGGLVAVASGRGHEGAITIQQRDAVMWVARLSTDDAIELPEAPFVHVFVADGLVQLSGRDLVAGDAVRLTAAGSQHLTAAAQSEVIVWETHEEANR
ncbi:MAG: pirin family protein [Acidimicrobiia bacterium]|nr:pirin family protein [Acidimicrobiia bacterium]